MGIRNRQFLDDTITYLKETNRLKKAHHTLEVGQMKKEHTEIQTKLDRLMDLRLDGEITKEDFEMKKRRLKDRQYELTQLVHTYDKADDEFTKRMEMLLNLTHEAPKIWASSTISQKRELLNFLFANLQLKGATLCYTLRKPFDSFLIDPESPNWRCAMCQHLKVSLAEALLKPADLGRKQPF